MPINFQSPTPQPDRLWRKPSTWAVILGLAIEAGGLAYGIQTRDATVIIVALSATTFLGIALALSERR